MEDTTHAQHSIAGLLEHCEMPAGAGQNTSQNATTGTNGQGVTPVDRERSPRLNEREDSAAASSLTDRLRQKTDSFDFEALLSPERSLDKSAYGGLAASRQAGETTATPLESETPPVVRPPRDEGITMADALPNLSIDVTARLVEQLARTTERLERLEEAMRKVSLLPALRREPIARELTSEVSTAPGNAVQEAKAGGQRSVGFDPIRESEAHFRRGVALCQANKLDDAITAWQQVLRLQPDNTYALANIGIVYTEQARWSEAYDMFTRVVALKPDSAEAQYGLGMAHAQLGDYSAAFVALETTLRLNPDNADARYNLDLVRQRLALDNVGSVTSLQEDAENTPPALESSAPSVFTPATSELSMSYGSPRKGDVSEVRGKVQSSPFVHSDTVPSTSGNVRQSDAEPVEQGSTTSRARPSISRKTGLSRAGWIAAATVALTGTLFYLRWLSQRPINETTAAATVRLSENPKASLPITISPLASKPEPSTVKPVATPPAYIPAAVEPSAVLRRPVNTRVQYNRPEIAGGKSHPHSRTGLRPGRATFQAHRSRQHNGVPHKDAPHPGYNQGIDKLLDRMP